MDMQSSSVKSVLLPDGRPVDMSEIPQKWWEEDNKSGFINPDQLAPDPEQPRRHMKETDLDNLQESIDALGVRETLTVTPLKHTPWAEVEPEYNDTFFLIVSGHRRWTCACASELEAVPIKVRIYESEKDHLLDRSLLNSNRKDITRLERGYEIIALRKSGWKINELAKFFGYAVPGIYNRMYLTKLHPYIQEFLDPSNDKIKKRFPSTVAGKLGNIKAPTVEEYENIYELFEGSFDKEKVPSIDELSDDDERRLAFQLLLFSVIRHRKLSSVRAIELIKEHKLTTRASNGGYGKRTQRYMPSRRRDVLNNFVGEILGSIVMDWPPLVLEKTFELSTYEQVDEFVQKIGNAEGFLGGLVKILSRIRDRKKPSSPEVLVHMEKYQKKKKI